MRRLCAGHVTFDVRAHKWPPRARKRHLLLWTPPRLTFARSDHIISYNSID